MLAVAAHIPSAEIGSGYFQETKPERLFAECSHYCELISSPKQMLRTLELAIRAAVGKGGVAVIVIPGDVVVKDAPDVPIPPRAGLLPLRARILPQEAELDALAAMLNRTRRAMLLGGRGCAGAHAQMLRFADILAAPIVHALGGKEHVEYDNPYDVGMTGLIGFSSGYRAMLNCDMLPMLGTDFLYRQFYPTGVPIAQIDLRPEHLGRRCKLDLGLVSDVVPTLDALFPKLARKEDRVHPRCRSPLVSCRTTRRR